MKKRWLCVCLLLAVVLNLGIPVSADEFDGLRQEMRGSFEEESMLDISSYELTLPEVQDIYDGLYHSGQLPWYASADCDYVFGQDQIIVKFRPKELNPKVYDRDLYEQKMAELIAETCLPDMEPWEKALSVYNHIALHTVYDEDMDKNTGYDSLVNGSTVCYGYSMLFMDVMNRLQIPCQIVVCYDTGDRYGHAWNAIQLDGQWYHVDLTWADPVPDTYGFAQQMYFLKTDEEFKEGPEPHDFEWDALVTMAEEPFTRDDFLDDVSGAVGFLDAHTVVFRQEDGNRNQIISRNLQTEEETVLYKYDRKDMNLGYGWYLYPTCGLDFWNGRIYFNREDKVLSMLPDGSDVQEVYYRQPDDKYLMGCMVDEGVLYLSLADHELMTEAMEVPLENAEFHTHSYKKQIVVATCLEEGYHHMVCECGIAYNRTVIPTIRHLMETQVTRVPAVGVAGESEHTCILCGHKEYEEIPALPEPAPVEEPEKFPSWIPAAAVGGCVILLVLAGILAAAKRRARCR